MNHLDKAFIEAYERQGVSIGERMSLSHAMELSHTNEFADSVAEPAADENNGAGEQPVYEPPAYEAIEPVAGIATSEPPELRALLQVDDLAWPNVCQKLGESGGDQIAMVADRVASHARGGGKVIGIAGDCAGNGCTTLLLCLAKHLAEHLDGGLRVVVVDTNSDNPSIARDLGLLPDVGWKDVAAGRLPLVDALIDSLDDGLTVLPYAANMDVEYGEGPGSVGPDSAGSNGGFENLQQLASHYDIVLADLGVLPAARGDHPLLNCIDAAVIVRSACVTRSDVSRRFERILQTSGVGIIGVVENRYSDLVEENSVEGDSFKEDPFKDQDVIREAA